MFIELAVRVGYERKRPSTDDRWEQRFDSIGLLLVGAAVAIVVIVFLVPRILGWLATL